MCISAGVCVCFVFFLFFVFCFFFPFVFFLLFLFVFVFVVCVCVVVFFFGGGGWGGGDMNLPGTGICSLTFNITVYWNINSGVVGASPSGMGWLDRVRPLPAI